ncbi:Disrupted in schizophrenia 1 protein [Triplophysa tibetana]|uniref:Disrupted in schizophrenia 1 protein n=1 Tax=Triplophysa tibetana TaxID=1572043 RepID=A0A5A9PAU0_9TELE|nr:Disrupted in schizophrenia 1 protein [Triplophysa tibetana]
MMFEGMIRVDGKPTTHENDPKCYRWAVRSDGVTDSRHRRSFRQPGYMRTEPLSQPDAAVSLPSNTSCDSQRNLEIQKSNQSTNTSISELPSSLSEKLDLERDDPSNSQTASKPHRLHRSQVEETSRCDVFNSSFSFIQQSLETSDLLDTTTSDPSPSLDQTKSEPSDLSTLKPCTFVQSKISPVPISQSGPEVFMLGQLPCSMGQPVKSKGLLLDEESWDLDRRWDTRTSSSMTSDFKESVSDCGSTDAEVTSSLSVDSSDSTSASSVTSGYDSATPSADHNRSRLRKCEDVLQDCLQNNRANTKIKSMMLKLQRLQHRAVLDDDYDTAERFGQKLEDLRRERAALKASLPSRHPAVSEYLQTLRTAAHSALQWNSSQYREKDEACEDQKCSGSSSVEKQKKCREKLIQEKQRIQREMCDLQRRLEELQEQSRAVEVQLAPDERRREEERLEEEVPVLKGCDVAQLRLMGRALEDMMTSEHRAQISASPPAEIIRLQEQEQALSLSIKDTTAKSNSGVCLENGSPSSVTDKMSFFPPVLMSQKLVASLRRKVNETETQLSALQEAKLAAVSGNDFSSAKELKTEIRNASGERDRVETLVRKLQALSTGSGQELTRMKEKLNQIKLDLQRREAQRASVGDPGRQPAGPSPAHTLPVRSNPHVSPNKDTRTVFFFWFESDKRGLKENALKYIELLEEQRHSCGGQALEHIWEAELEACHLLLKGLELRTPSISETKDLTSIPESSSNVQPCTDEEADCAMLTALGGRWCPEANLQHSEFTKKLEEFLFCVEDCPEDLCGDEAELTVRCDLIRGRLHYLEDQLHTPMENLDKDLAHILTQLQPRSPLQPIITVPPSRTAKRTHPLRSLEPLSNMATA